MTVSLEVVAHEWDDRAACDIKVNMGLTILVPEQSTARNGNRHQRPEHFNCDRNYHVGVCTFVGSMLIGAVMPKAAILWFLPRVGANVTASFQPERGRKNPLEEGKELQPSKASPEANQTGVLDDEVQSLGSCRHVTVCESER